MTRFAANLSMLFTDLPFLDRLDAAARASFDAVEFWWPAQAFADGTTMSDIVKRVRDLQLRVVLLNFDAGDMPAGDRGLAGDPERAALFRKHVPLALEFAQALACSKLNALAGNSMPGWTVSDQLSVLVDSVAFAADQALGQGASIMLEALNPVDTPRYLLPHADTALAVIERTGRPNVAYQLDTYHVAKAGDDVLAAIEKAGKLVGHVQFADFPGRHEPGSGELPFDRILEALDQVGYVDAIGLEFAPLDPKAPNFSCREQLGA
jgi:hydroxypyruvate isomerase